MKTPPTIILLAALMLLGCSLQAMAQGRPSSVINISVKGDRLAFASVADYKRAVDQPSKETKEQLARKIAALKGFTSFAQKQNSSTARQVDRESVKLLIEDEYFASILNANLVVQIGDQIFHINPSAERVYVLPAAYENEYSDLVNENTRNPHIRTFSTNDDVIEAIQGGPNGQETLLFCTQSGIGGRYSQTLMGGGNKLATAEFKKYGIFFSLFATVDPQGTWPSPFTFDFTGGIGANAGYVYYHVRCGNTVSYAISTKGSWLLTKQKYQSYQGSKNLNEVYFFYRLKDGGSFATPPVGFRVNK